MERIFIESSPVNTARTSVKTINMGQQEAARNTIQQ